MSEKTAHHDRARLVAATASRLRLVQTDLADQDPRTRRDYLSDEIERALAQLVPEQRQAFLEDLAEQFPTWDAMVDVRADQNKSAAPMDARELKDPSFLVSRLIEAAGSLDAQQKHALATRLAEAGLNLPGSVEWPQQQADALRSKLQAAATDPLDAARMLDLLAALVEFVTSVDQLAWTTWRTVAPRSAVKRPQTMLRDMARFVSGDPDTPRGQVSASLDRLRQLLAAIISSISQAGRQFAHAHAVKFSPEAIENLAGMERGGMLVSREVKCWRKYIELSSNRDEAAVESEIMQAVAEYAESLMKGPGR